MTCKWCHEFTPPNRRDGYCSDICKEWADEAHKSGGGMTDDLARAEIEAILRAFMSMDMESSTLLEMAEAAHAAASRVREERGFVVRPMVYTMPNVGTHADHTCHVQEGSSAASQQRTADNGV